jgi:RimJ/RimL family protein N-acetyltransferase
MADKRYLVEWQTAQGLCRAFEPTAEEVAAAAGELAAYYNDAHNSAMMAHSAELSAAEVVEHFDGVRGDGGRAFLLQLDGRLVGDADFRHVTPTAAEFAIMVGARSIQGKGLGTRFAAMLHAFAFAELGLDRVFVTIIPANLGSQRLFQKLGYEPDDGPEARSYVDEEDDLSFSLGRAKFEREHGTEQREIRWSERPSTPAAPPRPA